MSGFKLIIEKHIRLTMLLMLVLHFSCYVVHGKGELYNEMSAVDEKDNAPKKYGERLNRHTRDNLPFRSEKINLVWSKALKRYEKEDAQVRNLFRDLQVQDELEMELKRSLVDNRDPYGEQAAIVRRKLLNIMTHYGLDHHLRDIELMRSRDENESVHQRDGNKEKNQGEKFLTDKRLLKIWQKSVFLGFSDEELNDLKSELIHQQQKVDEFSALKDELDQAMDVMDNSITRVQKDDVAAQTLDRKRIELKRLNREIKDGYSYLDATATRSPNGADLEFTDPRVVSLWAQVKTGNFTDSEAESFKEELKHFERKLEKHKYLKSEMLASQGRSLTPSDGKVKLMHEHQLNQKIEDYGRKVKKTFTDLKYRIDRSSIHNEL